MKKEAAGYKDIQMRTTKSGEKIEIEKERRC